MRINPGPSYCLIIQCYPLSLDSVRVAVQPTGQGEAPEMVPSLSTQGKEEDPEGTGVHYSLKKKQNV